MFEIIGLIITIVCLIVTIITGIKFYKYANPKSQYSDEFTTWWNK